MAKIPVAPVPVPGGGGIQWEKVSDALTANFTYDRSSTNRREFGSLTDTSPFDIVVVVVEYTMTLTAASGYSSGAAYFGIGRLGDVGKQDSIAASDKSETVSRFLKAHYLSNGSGLTSILGVGPRDADRLSSALILSWDQCSGSISIKRTVLGGKFSI